MILMMMMVQCQNELTSMPDFPIEPQPGYLIAERLDRPDTKEMTCMFNKCGDLGDPCDADRNLCGAATYCSNGSCVPSILPGLQCNNWNDCNELEGYFCIPYPNGTKICSPFNYASIGENCTYDHECLFELKCLNGHCAFEKYDDVECIFDSQCPLGQYCDEQKCRTLQLKDGECEVFSLNFTKCFDGEGICRPSSNRSRIGTCVRKINAGELCLRYHLNCDISHNEFCVNVDGSLFGICKKIEKRSYKTCFFPKDCLDWEYCKCDRSSSVGYCTTVSESLGRHCVLTLLPLLECYLNSSCDTVFSLNPHSCLHQHCRQEVRCVLALCIDPTLPRDSCKGYSCDLTQYMDWNNLRLIPVVQIDY
ncbi:hypothetical protein DFA_04860 [Cavenderia fasciculata]|uniref:Dickkopf N-terminal cysteine-rich domain-containing protein n=1 Tax=Cavenderia fasciculata TaxID=261658 RepID=F4PM27_CACFS|nr:uncharacterized protein DFA_04860 [Cavenderia fasciculata]EGG22730.1 hypothetical protein DFA_04860 [Cavenderia fasciculata]|eukprot:XP_004360581.1 hypothetical protein DFA_04860 [Cavenderia fasciculata]